jgi:ubiquinone/menaquinone biosynthesis C-methylase UbiE
LCEYGRFRPGERLLEIGCGVGNFTRIVREATGASILGVDISPDLVEEARRRVPGEHFEVADVHRLGFPDSSFDAVYGSSILHHLELDAALREMLRVLKPGGRLVFAEPNMLNPQIWVTKNIPWVKRRMHETPHETAYVRGWLARDLRRAGFVAVRIFPFDFLHPHVPARLIEAVEGLGKVLERVPLIREIAGSCLIYAEKERA